MTNMPLEFIIMGCLGITCEVMFDYGSRRFVDKEKGNVSGRSYPIMFPIYGFMAPALHVTEPMIGDLPTVARGAILAAGIMATEYISGRILHSIYGKAPWEESYHGKPDSIHDLVRLRYAPLWGLLGISCEMLHHKLSSVESFFS